MLQAPQRIHSGALVGVHGVKPLKDSDLFTSEGKINCLKKKKRSKPMYFERNFNAKML